MLPFLKAILWRFEVKLPSIWCWVFLIVTYSTHVCLKKRIKWHRHFWIWHRLKFSKCVNLFFTCNLLLPRDVFGCLCILLPAQFVFVMGMFQFSHETLMASSCSSNRPISPLLDQSTPDFTTFRSVGEWLEAIKMERYRDNFTAAGYSSLDSVARMSIE